MKIRLADDLHTIRMGLSPGEERHRLIDDFRMERDRLRAQMDEGQKGDKSCE